MLEKFDRACGCVMRRSEQGLFLRVGVSSPLHICDQRIQVHIHLKSASILTFCVNFLQVVVVSLIVHRYFLVMVVFSSQIEA